MIGLLASPVGIAIVLAGVAAVTLVVGSMQGGASSGASGGGPVAGKGGGARLGAGPIRDLEEFRELARGSDRAGLFAIPVTIVQASVNEPIPMGAEPPAMEANAPAPVMVATNDTTAPLEAPWYSWTPGAEATAGDPYPEGESIAIAESGYTTPLPLAERQMQAATAGQPIPTQ